MVVGVDPKWPLFAVARQVNLKNAFRGNGIDVGIRVEPVIVGTHETRQHDLSGAFDNTLRIRGTSLNLFARADIGDLTPVYRNRPGRENLTLGISRRWMAS